MKTRKLIVSVLFVSMVITTSVFAREKRMINPHKMVQYQVENIVSGIATSDTGTVKLSFVLSKEKGLEISKIESENSKLVKMVSERLKSRNSYFVNKMEGKYVIYLRFINNESSFYADNL